MHSIILCLKTSLMKLIKYVQNVTSLVANKKQKNPVRSYFYLLFHWTTSCSWHTQSLNKIYYLEIFRETVATAFKIQIDWANPLFVHCIIFLEFAWWIRVHVEVRTEHKICKNIHFHFYKVLIVIYLNAYVNYLQIIIKDIKVEKVMLWSQIKLTS